MIKENTSFNEQTSLDILKNRHLPIDEREENLLSLTKYYTQQQKTGSVIEMVKYSYAMSEDNSKMYVAKIQNLILETVSKNDQD